MGMGPTKPIRFKTKKKDVCYITPAKQEPIPFESVAPKWVTSSRKGSVGEKVAMILEKTMNEVDVYDKDIVITQNCGIVQGGSDCVAKFSQCVEVITEAAITKSGMQGLVLHQDFVDDIAILADHEKALTTAMA